MVTKIGLPENRRRLKGLGVEHERSQSFDKGYNAGFDDGRRYLREQIAQEIEAFQVTEYANDYYKTVFPLIQQAFANIARSAK